MPFGDPSSGVDPDTGEDIKIFTIHSSGFGDPKTKWTDADEA